GGVRGAARAPARPAGEGGGGHEGRVAAAGRVGHLCGHRVDRPAQVLEHVEAVALGLDEVGVRGGAGSRLAPPRPGGWGVLNGMAKNGERAPASRSRTSASSRSKTNGFSTSSGKPARMTLSV